MRPLYIFGFPPSSPFINVVLLRFPVSATNFSWEYNVEGGGGGTQLQVRLVSKCYVHDCSFHFYHFSHLSNIFTFYSQFSVHLILFPDDTILKTFSPKCRQLNFGHWVKILSHHSKWFQILPHYSK